MLDASKRDDSTRGPISAALQALDTIWSSLDLTRGSYDVSYCLAVVVGFLVFRRIECLDDPAAIVLTVSTTIEDRLPSDRSRICGSILSSAGGNAPHLLSQIAAAVTALSPSVRDLFEAMEFRDRCESLDRDGLLAPIAREFINLDLRPATISNDAMGGVLDWVLTRFAQRSRDMAGEHYTATDVVHLMADLLIAGATDAGAAGPYTVFDPAAGTGGALSAVQQRLQDVSANNVVDLFGQEINRETYGICKARLFLTGQDIDHIRFGDSLGGDAFGELRFDLMLCNPPYGANWKNLQDAIQDEHYSLGQKGRFGPGLPRVSDSQMLFLLHLISKMQPKDETHAGSRIAIVMTGSTLFSGGPGSGESEIRRYILENDFLEAIIALPGGLYYNTAIGTYVWLLTNAKPEERHGLVQLVDGSGLLNTLRDSIGSKTREITARHAEDIVGLVHRFTNEPHSKIVNRNDFSRYAADDVNHANPPYVGIAIEALFLDDALEAWAIKTRQRLFSFGDVIAETSQVRQHDLFDDTNESKSIYLPVLGSGPALTSVTEKDRAKYVRLVVREDVATAKYVAAFYNSAAGKNLRKASSSGAGQQRLFLETLLSSRIALPCMEDQIACIEADTTVENLLSELTSLRTRIWQKPTSSKTWLREIGQVNKVDTLHTWLDSLPYPLAAILLNYEATSSGNYKDRYEVLLHFFEALAEFLASIYLSAITESTAHAAGVSYPMDKSPLRNGLRISTFGSWIELCKRFTKFARSLHDGSDEQQAVILQAFGTSNRELLNILFSQRVTDALERAKNIRNAVKGHGGYVTKESARATHADLEGLLADIRSEFGQMWMSLPLFRAGACSHGRLILQTVESLMGRSVPFPQKQVVVSKPVDSERLFLLASDGSQPLTLLPLLMLGPTPHSSQTAVYFYNRDDSAGPRYISYQFVSEAEIVDASADLRTSLEGIWAVTDPKRK